MQFARENSVDLDINKSSQPARRRSVQSIGTSATTHAHAPDHNASVLIAAAVDEYVHSTKSFYGAIELKYGGCIQTYFV